MTETAVVLAREQPSDVSLPALVTTGGPKAARRFLEFFTVNIRNPHTRAAYGRAAGGFLRWCEARGISDLERIEPMHVAAYIEELGRTVSKPTVKQHLATIRMLFDWLVVGQVVAVNPAASVRGPKYSVSKGLTPVISAEEARELFSSMDLTSVVGLRDRAIIGVLTYTFARVSAMISLRVEDYYPQGKKWWLRLHEKNGKVNEMPCHPVLIEYLDTYMDAAGIGEEKKGPLFRSTAGRTQKLTLESLDRGTGWLCGAWYGGAPKMPVSKQP